jgi:hypothetical protein
MEGLKSVWGRVRKWAVVAAIATTLVWLWRLFSAFPFGSLRKSQLSPEAPEPDFSSARQESKEKAQEKRDRVDEAFNKYEGEFRDKFGPVKKAVLTFLLVLPWASCASVVSPVQSPASDPLDNPIDDLVASCLVQGEDSVVCPRHAFVKAGLSCLQAARANAKCQVDLDEIGELCGIDRSEFEHKIRACEARLEGERITKRSFQYATAGLSAVVIALLVGAFAL